MNRFLFCLTLLILGLAHLHAQPATPARPADPNQPLPAQPVMPNLPVPAAPATPATPVTSEPAPSTTNAAVTVNPQNSLAVIADSSLKQVLQELAQSWADSQDSSPQVPLSLTNAGTIRSKVEGGSVWDVVITADIQDAKEMTDQGALLAAGQRSLARNTVVIYGRNPLIKDDDLDWFDLIGTEWKKVALGNPDLVASGRVAKHALEKHGLLDDDHKKIFTYAGSEALVLGVAQREQADAVFVYKTDLAPISLPGLQVFPLKSEDAPPVFYTAAVCRASKNPALAHAFIDYCTGDAARAIWAKYGFETN